MQRLEKLENENNALREMISKLEARVAALETGDNVSKPASKPVSLYTIWIGYSLYSLVHTFTKVRSFNGCQFEDDSGS